MANAVLDGVDGILLGAETLRGKYPVQTVQTILAICRQAEKAFDHNYHFEHLMAVSVLHTLLTWDILKDTVITNIKDSIHVIPSPDSCQLCKPPS